MAVDVPLCVYWKVPSVFRLIVPWDGLTTGVVSRSNESPSASVSLTSKVSLPVVVCVTVPPNTPKIKS